MTTETTKPSPELARIIAVTEQLIWVRAAQQLRREGVRAAYRGDFQVIGVLDGLAAEFLAEARRLGWEG